jgi:hypothetical protein
VRENMWWAKTILKNLFSFFFGGNLALCSKSKKENKLRRFGSRPVTNKKWKWKCDSLHVLWEFILETHPLFQCPFLLLWYLSSVWCVDFLATLKHVLIQSRILIPPRNQYHILCVCVSLNCINCQNKITKKSCLFYFTFE